MASGRCAAGDARPRPIATPGTLSACRCPTLHPGAEAHERTLERDRRKAELAEREGVTLLLVAEADDTDWLLAQVRQLRSRQLAAVCGGATDRAVPASAELIKGPAVTQWRSPTARPERPGGVQLTLFEEPDPAP